MNTASGAAQDIADGRGLAAAAFVPRRALHQIGRLRRGQRSHLIMWSPAVILLVSGSALRSADPWHFSSVPDR